MTSTSHEFRMLAIVTILTGSVVISLDQFSQEPIGNTVRLAQNSSSLKNLRTPGLDASREGQDTGRMDMRSQSLQAPGDGQIRTTQPSSEMPRSAVEFDSRRDDSRMDMRQGGPLPVAPSSQAADLGVRTR
jgi:hypothetical protein